MLLNRAPTTSIGDNAFTGIKIRSSKTNCQMRFWFWLTDSDFGSVSISTREAVGKEMFNIFTLTSPTAEWKRIDVNIPESNSPFQVPLKKKNMSFFSF